MSKQSMMLEDRLVDFAVIIIEISDSLKSSKAGSHLGSQIMRSGTSTALNYGEAQSAESRKDFIHKMKVVLKELRETLVCLKIIDKSNLLNDLDKLGFALQETNELISIFVKSVKTSELNAVKK